LTFYATRLELPEPARFGINTRTTLQRTSVTITLPRRPPTGPRRPHEEHVPRRMQKRFAQWVEKIVEELIEFARGIERLADKYTEMAINTS
jgi:hypothetical protein